MSSIWPSAARTRRSEARGGFRDFGLRRVWKGEGLPRYKDHPIYGIGVPAGAQAWHCRGLIFDPGDKVTEIKKLERADLTFDTLPKAEAQALQLCKTWIDEQSAGVDSKGAAVALS